MNGLTDLDLLREYAARGSEPAFEALFERYSGLVYSAALRQTESPPLAEDITQSVFLILARKAGGIRAGVVLPGWLLVTTRLVALNALRREANRRRVEREAMELHATEQAAAWERMGPLLDEVLFQLSEKDRNLVALRFFAGKSFREVGEAVGITEDYAQKRVSRALDRLRTGLARRGVAVPGAVCASLLVTHAVRAAPSHLAAPWLHVVAGAVAPSALSPLTRAGLSALKLRCARTLASRAALAGGCVLLLFLVAQFRPVAPRASRAAWQQARTEATAPVGGQQRPPGPLPIAPRQVDFKVVEASSGSPIRGAMVAAIWAAALPHGETNWLKTDESGVCHVPYGVPTDENWLLHLRVIANGYVPRLVRWSGARGDVFDQVPVEYTLALGRAQTMGGLVLNADGAGVAHAELRFGARPPPLDGYGRREAIDLAHSDSTDDRGRWLCDHLPPDLDLIEIRVSHPDYEQLAFSEGRPAPPYASGQRFSRAALLSQTAVFVMQPRAPDTNAPAGLEESPAVSQTDGVAAAPAASPTSTRATRQYPRFSGTVTDRDSGEPVPDFEVWMGHDLMSGIGMLLQFEPTLRTTGQGGRFRFLEITPYGTAPTAYNLTVKAQGYRPLTRVVRGSLSGNLEIDFAPEKVRPVRGVVLSPRGLPLAGAVVQVVGGEGPAYMRQPARLDLALSQGARTCTNTNGGFELDPGAGRAVCVFHPDGYGTASLRDLPTSGVLRLDPWGRVEGNLAGQGEAVAHRSVRLDHAFSPAQLREIDPQVLQVILFATSDDQGRFVFEGVPAGRWEISTKSRRPVGASPLAVVLTMPPIEPEPPESKVEVEIRPGQTGRVELPLPPP